MLQAWRPIITSKTALNSGPRIFISTSGEACLWSVCTDGDVSCGPASLNCSIRGSAENQPVSGTASWTRSRTASSKTLRESAPSLCLTVTGGVAEGAGPQHRWGPAYNAVQAGTFIPISRATNSLQRPQKGQRETSGVNAFFSSD